MKRTYIRRMTLAAAVALFAAFWPMNASAREEGAPGFVLQNDSFGDMQELSGVTADIPEIRMDVSEIGKKTASFAVGQLHTWFICADVPRDIADAGQYTITQTLAPGLTYEAESLNLSLVTKSGREVPLRMESHYNLVIGAAEEENRSTDRISVSLTPAGLAYVSGHLENGVQKPELKLSYRAFINQNASLGSQLIGAAQLNYIGRENRLCQAFSNKTVVCTGGLHILLTDAGNVPLSGGTFMIARPAQDAERTDEDVIVELLDTGEDQTAVVYEEFYTLQSMAGEKQARVATDSEGAALIYGLPYGSYYLVQIEAPEGVQQMGLPVSVEINEVSHLASADGWQDSSGRIVDHTIHIVNESPSIPATGGPGTTEIRVFGMLTLLSACLLLFFNHKKEYRK